MNVYAKLQQITPDSPSSSASSACRLLLDYASPFVSCGTLNHHHHLNHHPSPSEDLLALWLNSNSSKNPYPPPLSHCKAPFATGTLSEPLSIPPDGCLSPSFSYFHPVPNRMRVKIELEIRYVNQGSLSCRNGTKPNRTSFLLLKGPNTQKR